MEKGGEQIMKPESEENKKKLEGLLMESSPYTQYKNLEEYKSQGYGAKGSQQPNPGRGAAGSTDAPTLAGGDRPAAS